jgi:hypothetical protein
LIVWVASGLAVPARAENPESSKATSVRPESTPETFFSAPTKVRLIAGPWTRLTVLGGSDFAVVAGGGGGLLFYDRLVVMGYACSISSRDVSDDASRKFEVAGVGGQVAWVLAPRKRLHGVAGALIGSTSAQLTSKTDANDTTTLSFFSVEPYAEVEASVYTGLRVFAGAGYRVAVGGESAAGVDSGYLRGPTVEFGFRMGN